MISAIAITLNEEENIESYIKSLSFANEIIIVDSSSTDQTVTLAKKLGASVIQREFDNFSEQKNFALEQANYEWVVFFDLDEIVTKELADEILEIANSETSKDAYKVKRNFYFMGKHMKYSGFQNDKVFRLFRKSKCRYNGDLVHEELEVNGKIGSLRNHSNHFSYKSFDDYNRKLTRYSKLQAKVLFQKGKKPRLHHFIIRPSYRFFHQYFIRLGILDGKEGLINACLSGFAVFKRYLFLWTMHRNIS